MEDRIPSLRMIAGPNGSGKSSLKEDIGSERLGVYVNPDEIELSLQSDLGVDIEAIGVPCSATDLIDKIPHLGLPQHWQDTLRQLKVDGSRLKLKPDEPRSYQAAAITEAIRQVLIELRISFTFETVMSHKSKVNLLCEAQARGFRTYLYYVATDSPDLNVERVRLRVERGGHDVPEKKIRERYTRSLSLLVDAIRCTNRAYLFDNTSEGSAKEWLAEFTDGAEYEFKTRKMPQWFIKHVIDRLEKSH
jgi:predicted ABC-type ATPase